MPDRKRVRIEAAQAARKAEGERPGPSTKRTRRHPPSSRANLSERTRAPRGRGGGKSSRRRSGSHSNES